MLLLLSAGEVLLLLLLAWRCCVNVAYVICPPAGPIAIKKDAQTN
jgi:hypothetical protein